MTDIDPHGIYTDATLQALTPRLLTVEGAKLLMTAAEWKPKTIDLLLAKPLIRSSFSCGKYLVTVLPE